MNKVSKRRTILEVQAEFPDVLVLKYENKKNVTVRGACGHARSTEVSSLRKGSRCGKCFGSTSKGVIDYQRQFDDILVLAVNGSRTLTVKYECGHVATTQSGHLQKGKRCAQCSHNAPKGVLEYQTEFPDLLVLKVESSFAVTVKYECGHVAKTTAGSLRAGSRCGQCHGNAPRSVLQRQAEFPDLLVLKVESASAVTVRGKCGHVWTAAASHLRAGQRCRRCANYGYNPGKLAWLYFMERPGEMQIGITNVPKKRLATHARDGWELIEMDGPHDGTAILNREAAIKKHLKTNDLLIEGTHENWPTAMWSPQSLATIEHAAQQLVAA